MLKRPSVLPKSQKTTFYAVFTFVSDVSTFLLVKYGKTACHGRFRSRPVPPPLCPDLDLRGGHLPLYLCACRLPRRRLLPFSACPGGAASSRSPPSVLPLRASRSRSPSPPRSLGHAAPVRVRRCGVGVPDSRPAPSRAADRGCACAHRREAVPAVWQRRQGRIRSPRTALTPAQTAASPAGPHRRRLRRSGTGTRLPGPP